VPGAARGRYVSVSWAQPWSERRVCRAWMAGGDPGSLSDINRYKGMMAWGRARPVGAASSPRWGLRAGATAGEVAPATPGMGEAGPPLERRPKAMPPGVSFAATKALSALPQLVRSMAFLALDSGIPDRMKRSAAKLQGRHSGRMPESSGMDGTLTASTEVPRQSPLSMVPCFVGLRRSPAGSLGPGCRRPLPVRAELRGLGVGRASGRPGIPGRPEGQN
jgi:hypothetical protein